RVGRLERDGCPTLLVRPKRVVDTVGEVDRRRTRRTQPRRIGTHLRAAKPYVRGERHAERARGAERRRTANGQAPDRVHQLGHGRALHEAEPPRELPLVDEPHPTPPPRDRRRDRVALAPARPRPPWVARFSAGYPPRSRSLPSSTDSAPACRGRGLGSRGTRIAPP